MRSSSAVAYWVASVSVGLWGPAPVLAAGAGADSISIQVIVDDRAQVLPRVLDLAEKESARIYRSAGVPTTWRAASSSKEDLAEQDEDAQSRPFVVRVIIQAVLQMEGMRATRFQMGATPLSGGDCGGASYIFYDQIVAFSNARRLDTALTLGTVVAHEIGHALLREGAHSREGLMRASWDASDWDRATRGFLLFSATDTAAVRAALTSCQR